MKKLVIAAVVFFAFSLGLWTWRVSAAPVNTAWQWGYGMMGGYGGYGMHGSTWWGDSSTRNEQEYLRLYQWVDEDTQDLVDIYLADLITSTDWDSLTASEVPSKMQHHYGEAVDYIEDIVYGE